MESTNTFKIPSMDFMLYYAAAEAIFPLVKDLCAMVKEKKECANSRNEIEEKQGLLYDELLAIQREFNPSVPKLERTLLPRLKIQSYLKLVPITPDALLERTIAFYQQLKALDVLLHDLAKKCLDQAELYAFQLKISQFDIQLRPLMTAVGFREYALNFAEVPLKKLGFSDEMAKALMDFIRQDTTMPLSSEFFFEELRWTVEEICIMNR